MPQKEIPVYIFTGFLEAGKTRFLQGTMEDESFNAGEPTLILLCEEGIEELAPENFPDQGKNVAVRVIDSPEELTPASLEKMVKDTKAERVMIEYNGMWMLDQLFNNMPKSWIIYQELFFADATTFLSYNANMRGLVVDKLKTCEMAVFNRFDEKTDKMELHKIVRGVSRRADIAYEHPDGEAEFDDIIDPLPFDLDAPVIEIKDGDYALWYRDVMEEPDKYDGKTIRFKGRVALDKKFPPNTFAAGRHVMTCCVQDISYCGVLCEWTKTQTMQNRDWMDITARISVKYHKVYGEKGPVLKVISAQKAEAPEQEVATFF